MTAKENTSDKALTEQRPRAINTGVLITVSMAFLTAASILLMMYQANLALHLRIDASEVWSDYQVRIIKSTTEEDPNLRAQYSEEQDVLRQHALELKQAALNARQVVKRSAYATVLLLLATAVAFLSLLKRGSLSVGPARSGGSAA